MAPNYVVHGPAAKNLLKDQLSKLQAKHQQECELLDDMSKYMLKRAQIEKYYGDHLTKLSAQFLSKKHYGVSEIGGSKNNNVYTVWRNILEENEKIGKARSAAVDVYGAQISEESKNIRNKKLAVSKKCLDQLSCMHKELQSGIIELDKTKKAYFDEEHVTHDIRSKATEAEEKLRKKKGHFFQSLSSLQKQSAKLSTKRDVCEEKSTATRNAYLLQLAAVNAHLHRFYEVDLPSIAQTMEGEVYEKLSTMFRLYAETEMSVSSTTSRIVVVLLEQALQIDPVYNQQCYSVQFPVLSNPFGCDFEACDGDNTKIISTQYGANIECEKEARKWATRVLKESKYLREAPKKIARLEALREKGNKTDPDDPTGREIEALIDEVYQDIRKAETGKLKAEARLEALRAGGVNVDDSLKAAAADVESLGAGLVRSASQVSVRSDLQEAAADYDEDYEEEHAVAPNSQAPQPQTVTTSNTSWDEPPSFDSTWASQDQSEATWPQPSPTVWTSQDQGPQSISIDEEPPAPESHTHPHIAQNGSAKPEEAPTERAIAIYPYTAVNDDELTIYESESLELFLEPDDGSGWVRAKNSTGLVGFVPRNYIQTDTSNEVDDDVQRQDSLFKENQDMYSNDISNSYEAEGSFSAVDYTTTPQQAAATTVNHAEGPAMVTDGTYYKALYEYEPVGPGELAFDEGAVIRVISKEGHTGVDDGWWFGEWNGTEGAFPSLLVRECVPTGELVSPTFEEGIEEDLDVVATPAGWAPPPMHAPPSPPTMNSETLSQAVEKKLLKAQAEMVQRDIIVTEPTPEIEERRILDEPPTQEDKEEEPPQDGDRQQELEEEVKAPPAEEVFQEVERVKKVEAEISSKAEGKPVKKAEAEPMKKAEAEPVKIVEAEQVKEVEAEPVKKAEVEPVKIVETEQVKKAEAEPMKKAEAEPMTIVTREKVEPQTPSASPVGDMPSEFMVSASEISAKCREEHLEEEPRPENPTVPPPTLSLPDPATIVVTAPTPVVEEKPLPEEEVDESSPAEFPPPPPPEASVEEDKEDQADAVEGIASVPPPFPEVIEDNVQEAALPPPEPPVAKTEVAKKAPPQLSLESPPEEIEVEKLKQLEHLRESDT